jgi:hypothetical protein
MVFEPPYAHCLWDDLKPRNSTKHRPSPRLKYAIWRSIYSEWILFGLARHKGAIRAPPDYAVENQDRCSVLLSLNYIPSLTDFTYRVTGMGNRNRGRDLAERAETPKNRSTRTDVLEAPPGGKSTHRSCAKHEEGGDKPNKERHHGDCRKVLE